MKSIHNYQHILTNIQKSFLFKRITLNPHFYNIQQGSDNNTNTFLAAYLSSFASTTINTLKSTNAIMTKLTPKQSNPASMTDDDDDEIARTIFAVTKPGTLLTSYNIDYRSLKTIFGAIMTLAEDQFLKFQDLLFVLVLTQDITSLISLPPQYHSTLAQIGSQFKLYRSFAIAKGLLGSGGNSGDGQNGDDDDDDDEETLSTNSNLLPPSHLALILLILTHPRLYQSMGPNPTYNFTTNWGCGGEMFTLVTIIHGYRHHNEMQPPHHHLNRSHPDSNPRDITASVVYWKLPGGVVGE